jgi:hypothetical protein
MGHNEESYEKLLTQLRKYMKKKALLTKNLIINLIHQLFGGKLQIQKINGSCKSWHFIFLPLLHTVPLVSGLF